MRLFNKVSKVVCKKEWVIVGTIAVFKAVKVNVVTL